MVQILGQSVVSGQTTSSAYRIRLTSTPSKVIVAVPPKANQLCPSAIRLGKPRTSACKKHLSQADPHISGTVDFALANTVFDTASRVTKNENGSLSNTSYVFRTVAAAFHIVEPPIAG